MKREYCLLTFNHGSRNWIGGKLADQHTPLTLHRSTLQQNGTGYLFVRSREGARMGTGTGTRIPFTLDGYFLKTTNTQTNQVTNIPLLTLTRETYRVLPDSMKKVSYSATQYDPLEEAVELWVEALPTPAPAPKPKHTLKAIPQRIALLIAEDAQKNNDSCAITMDTITPLTASVTTCFHCFDTDAIASWFTSKGGGVVECPMCKQPCLYTKAFVEPT
jgi:hypothetical protein